MIGVVLAGCAALASWYYSAQVLTRVEALAAVRASASGFREPYQLSVATLSSNTSRAVAGVQITLRLPDADPRIVIAEARFENLGGQWVVVEVLHRDSRFGSFAGLLDREMASYRDEDERRRRNLALERAGAAVVEGTRDFVAGVREGLERLKAD